MSMKIAVVVVTYNRLELLKENLSALLNQSYNNFDILLIDNASTDGTEEYIRSLNKDIIKYINTGNNLGGAGGFYLGIKEALRRGYDYAWLMDDDTIPYNNALESLINKMMKYNGKIAYISSLVKWTDDTICIMNKQTLLKNWENHIEFIKDNMLPIENASFVSFFLNLEDAKKVGLPQKDFFIYGDDWEYSLRLSLEKSGYIDLDSIVVHKMAKNCGVDILSEQSDRIKRYYYNYRNLYYIYKKYYDEKSVIKYKIRFFSTIFKILKSPCDKKIERIIIMTKGMIKGRKYNPTVEYFNYF